MKKIPTLIAAFLSTAVFGCSGLDIAVRCDLATESEPLLDKAFIVREAESAMVESERLVVKFLAKQSDSRCTAVCVWEGEASVLIEIASEESAPERFVLSTANQNNFRNSAEYGEYMLRLTGVIPYPDANRAIEPVSSCVALLIAKIKLET